MPRGRRFHGTWALALLVAAAGVAAAAETAPPPEQPRRLPPVRIERSEPALGGLALRLSWGALPPGTDEFEVLVEAQFPEPLLLRLTESEDPSLTEIDLFLPPLPATAARILLRAGSEKGERFVAESLPWRVPRRGGLRPSHAVLRQGELWLIEGEGPPAAGAVAPGQTLLPGRLPHLVTARTTVHAHHGQAPCGRLLPSDQGGRGAGGRPARRVRPYPDIPLRI